MEASTLPFDLKRGPYQGNPQYWCEKCRLTFDSPFTSESWRCMGKGKSVKHKLKPLPGDIVSTTINGEQVDTRGVRSTG